MSAISPVVGFTASVIDRATPNLNRMGVAMTKFQKRFGSVVNSLEESRLAMIGVSVGLGIATRKVTKFLGSSLSVAQDYEKSMARARAIFELTGKQNFEEWRKFTNYVKRTGIKTIFDPEQTAEAMANLGSAGLSVNKAMKYNDAAMTISEISQGMVGLADASELVIATMNQFKHIDLKPMTIAGRFAKAEMDTMIRMKDTIPYLQQLGPTARKLRADLSEMIAVGDVFKKIGLSPEAAKDTIKSLSTQLGKWTRGLYDESFKGVINSRAKLPAMALKKIFGSKEEARRVFLEKGSSDKLGNQLEALFTIAERIQSNYGNQTALSRVLYALLGKQMGADAIRALANYRVEIERTTYGINKLGETVRYEKGTILEGAEAFRFKANVVRNSSKAVERYRKEVRNTLDYVKKLWRGTLRTMMIEIAKGFLPVVKKLIDAVRIVGNALLHIDQYIPVLKIAGVLGAVLAVALGLSTAITGLIVVVGVAASGFYRLASVLASNTAGMSAYAAATSKAAGAQTALNAATSGFNPKHTTTRIVDSHGRVMHRRGGKLISVKGRTRPVLDQASGMWVHPITGRPVSQVSKMAKSGKAFMRLQRIRAGAKGGVVFGKQKSMATRLLAKGTTTASKVGGGIAKVGGKAAGWFKGLGALGKVTVVLSAVTALVSAFKLITKHMKDIMKFFKGLIKSVKKFVGPLVWGIRFFWIALKTIFTGKLTGEDALFLGKKGIFKLIEFLQGPFAKILRWIVVTVSDIFKIFSGGKGIGEWLKGLFSPDAWSWSGLLGGLGTIIGTVIAPGLGSAIGGGVGTILGLLLDALIKNSKKVWKWIKDLFNPDKGGIASLLAPFIKGIWEYIKFAFKVMNLPFIIAFNIGKFIIKGIKKFFTKTDIGKSIRDAFDDVINKIGKHVNPRTIYTSFINAAHWVKKAFFVISDVVSMLINRIAQSVNSVLSYVLNFVASALRKVRMTKQAGEVQALANKWGARALTNARIARAHSTSRIDAYARGGAKWQYDQLTPILKGNVKKIKEIKEKEGLNGLQRILKLRYRVGKIQEGMGKYKRAGGVFGTALGDGGFGILAKNKEEIEEHYKNLDSEDRKGMLDKSLTAANRVIKTFEYFGKNLEKSTNLASTRLYPKYRAAMIAAAKAEDFSIDPSKEGNNNKFNISLGVGKDLPSKVKAFMRTWFNQPSGKKFLKHLFDLSSNYAIGKVNVVVKNNKGK